MSWAGLAAQINAWGQRWPYVGYGLPETSSHSGRAAGNFLTDTFPTALQWIEAAFGADLTADPDTWSWTDITAYVQWDPGVEANIGYPDEAIGLVPAKFTAVLRNDQANGGDFTLGNALSPRWPNVRENTPIRARLDVGSGPTVRFFGYATSWKPKWDANRQLAIVTLTAHGVSRRLRQGQSTKLSPMYRYHMLAYRYPASTNPGWLAGLDQGYHAIPQHLWMLEEGAGAVRGENAANSGYPLQASSGSHLPRFGLDTELDCVKSMPQFNTGTSLSTKFPLVTPQGAVDTIDGASVRGVRVQCLLRLDQAAISALSNSLGTLADAAKARVLSVDVLSTGALARVHVYLDHDATDGLMLFAETKNAADTTLDTIGGIVGTQFERGEYITLDIVQVGADIEVRLGHLTLTLGPSAIGSVPVVIYASTNVGITGSTLNGIYGVTVAGTENLNGGSVGVVSVYGSGADYSAGDRYPRALLARSGDTVAERLRRLGIENNVTIEVVGDADLAMGAQSVAGFLDLVDEAQQVDQGILFDGLNSGFTYITRTAAYSRSAALTLDWNASDILEADPEQDDQRRVNDYTATNPAGSQQRFAQTSGDLGTNTVGTYDTGGDHRAAFGADLYQIAAWKVAQGTVSGLRYPRLKFNLAKLGTSRLAQRWLETTPLSRVDALALATPPDPDQKLLLRGWTEKWNSKIWEVTANVTPYDAFGVVSVAADSGDTDPFVGWLDTDGSTLSGAILPAETFADGFESGIGAWGSQNGWTLAQDTANVRTGTYSMKLTPPGATASGGAVAKQAAPRLPVSAGATYMGEVWFFSVAGWSDCRCAVDWYDGSNAFISSSLGSATNVPAGVWTVSRQTFTAPANAVTVQPRIRQGGTPAATDVLWSDDFTFHVQLQLITPSGPVWTNDSLSTYTDDINGLYLNIDGLKIRVVTITGTTSPQTFMLDPSTLLRPLSAGAAVSVWNPALLGL